MARSRPGSEWLDYRVRVAERACRESSRPRRAVSERLLVHLQRLGSARHRSHPLTKHALTTVAPPSHLPRHPGQGRAHAPRRPWLRVRARHEDRRVSAPPPPVVSRRRASRLVESPTRLSSARVANPRVGFPSFSDRASFLLPARCSESKTFDDDWLKSSSTVHLLTLFGWTVPSGVAIKSYGDTSLLGEAIKSYGELHEKTCPQKTKYLRGKKKKHTQAHRNKTKTTQPCVSPVNPSALTYISMSVCVRLFAP